MSNGILSLLSVLSLVSVAAPVEAQSAREVEGGVYTFRFPSDRLRTWFEAPPAAPPASPEVGQTWRGSDPVEFYALPSSGGSFMPVRGEPLHVHLARGEFHVEAQDLFVAGRGLDFNLTRKYRSRTQSPFQPYNVWVFGYNVFVESVSGGVVVHDGNARRDFFRLQENGLYVAPQLFSVGELQAGDRFEMTFPDGGRWLFLPLDGGPAEGRIEEIVDRNGNSLGFQYDGQGRLDTVTDTLGRAYDFDYDGRGRLISVTDFTGRAVTYDYYADGDAGGSAGDLKSVTTPAVVGTPTGNDFPAGRTTTYTYTKGFEDERLNHNLLTVTDPEGQTFISNTYFATTDPSDLEFDRIQEHTWGDAGETYSFDYQAVTPTRGNHGAVLTVEVNDRNGFVEELDYDFYNRLLAARDFTAGLHPGEPAFYETRYYWNDDSLVTMVVHPEGNRDRYLYADVLDPGGPERSRGNLHVLIQDPGPRGGSQETHVERYEYDDAGPGTAGHNFVTRHLDARGNERVNTYDARGNLLRSNPEALTVEELLFTYNPFGQVLTRTHADNGAGWRQLDVFEYYGPGDGAKEGYLKSVTEDVSGFACVTTYDVDARGNFVQETDPLGNQREYVYNSLDELVREVSPETGPGSGVRYETDSIYDANGNVVRVDRQNVDETGTVQPNAYLSTTYDYDVLNVVVRITEEVDPANNVVTEYEYDGNRNRVLVRSGEATNGNQPDSVLLRLYDERDLVFRQMRAPSTPEEQLFELDYDANGNLVRMAGHGRVHLYTYDGYDRLTEYVDPMGNEQAFEYDANDNQILRRVEGEPVDHPGGAGNVRLYEEARVYDELDRKISSIIEHFDAAGLSIGDGQGVTQWTYFDNSMIATVTDDNGSVTSYAYDTMNRVATVTDALGNERRYDYDCNHNVVREESLEKSDLGGPDALSGTSFAYDGLDRLASQTTDLGHTETRGYDSRDNTVVTVDAEGHETRYVYDGLDRLVQVIEDMNANGASAADPADVVVAQVWDDSGRCVSRTDPEGNATSYAYDALDRLTTTVYADGTSSSCVYDDCCNATVCFDPNGTQVQRAYDELDRPRFVNVTPGPGVAGTTTFEVLDFDGLGRLVQGQDDDSLVQVEYDSHSNVVRDVQNGQPVQHSFDGAGNCLSTGYPSGRTVGYQLDVLNRRKSASDDLGLIYLNHFAGPDRLEGRDLANDAVLRYQYDLDLRPIQIEHVLDPSGAAVVFDGRGYGLNANGSFHTVTELPPGGDTWSFLHDDLDRLVQSTYQPAVGPPLNTGYGLDRAGNRTGVVGGLFPGPYLLDPQDAPVNQYTQTPSGPRQHDDNGNVVFAQLGPQQRQLAYDYRNQMVQAVDPGSGLVTAYAYDVLGRRFLKVEDVTGTPVQTVFVHDGAQVIEEQDGFGGLLASYVCEVELDDVIQMERGGQVFYLHGDVNRSVLSVTDGAGNPVERYRYDDYGAPQFFDGLGNPMPGSNVGNPYLFTGRRLDQETGLYYMRARYYDMTSGRFLSRDPIGLYGDSLNSGNPYTFAGNGAASLWAADPTGMRTPRPSDKKFRDQLAQGGTNKDELNSYDNAVKDAGDTEKIIRLANGVWVPQGKRFATLKELLLYFMNGPLHLAHMWEMTNISPGCGCAKIIRDAENDAAIANHGKSYAPRTFRVARRVYTYVIVGGSVWVWDERNSVWKPTTLGTQKNGKGDVEPVIPTNRSGKPDSTEFGRQVNGRAPTTPRGAPKYPEAPSPSGRPLKPGEYP